MFCLTLNFSSHSRSRPTYSISEVDDQRTATKGLIALSSSFAIEVHWKTDNSALT
jgi:hypothetical protein